MLSIKLQTEKVGVEEIHVVCRHFDQFGDDLPGIGQNVKIGRL